MVLRKVIATAWAVGLIAVFALAFWSRASSLATAPDHEPDEAYLGYQASRLLAGESPNGRTTSGNPLNVFMVGADALLLAAFGPSLPMLRVPAVAFGCLAVALAYVLGRRAFDRTTALIAAALLASLPVMITYARIGWEASTIPLASLLALFAAARGSRAGLLGAFLLGLYIHPTFLFLSPLLLIIIAVRLLNRPADPARRWRPVLVTVAVALAIVVPFGLLKRRSTASAWVQTHALQGYPCDWPRFLKTYKGHLLQDLQWPPGAWNARDGAFWAIVGTVLVLGCRQHLRRRSWDRLAVVAGTLVGLAGYHLALGGNCFHAGMARYALGFAVPVAFAVACLVRPLMAVPAEGPTTRWHPLPIVGLVAACFALLGCFKANYFDHWNAMNGNGESFGTLRSEVRQDAAEIAGLILRDLGPAGGRPRAVLAADLNSPFSLRYLLSPRPDVRVVSFARVFRVELDRIIQAARGPHRDDRATLEGLRHVADERKRLVREQLLAGGYLVDTETSWADQLVRETFPPERLRSWRVRSGWHPAYVVHRLRRGREPTEGDGGPGATVAVRSGGRRAADPRPGLNR